MIGGHVRIVLAGVVAVLLAACGGPQAPAAPEGFVVVEHPEAMVAVPESWTAVDPRDFVKADPDYVELEIADHPPDGRFGARLGHYDRTMGRTFSSAESPVLLNVNNYSMDREQLRREEVELAGATEGFLLQIAADSQFVEEPVRVTFVSGLREDGAVIMMTIAGTESQIPDDVIATMVSTFTLTDPVPLDDTASMDET